MTKERGPGFADTPQSGAVPGCLLQPLTAGAGGLHSLTSAARNNLENKNPTDCISRPIF